MASALIVMEARRMKRKNSKTITLDLSMSEYEALKKTSAVCQTSVTRLVRDAIKVNLKTLANELIASEGENNGL